MSDVFISYAREDEVRAERLANALAAQGWSVWWDRKIPFGKPFDQVIEEALAGARCVLVLWSASSIASRWVLEEAHYGYESDILVPVSIDGAAPPIGFRRTQTANLASWDGQATFPAFRKLLDDIESVLESTPADRPEESPEAVGHRREAVKAERAAWSPARKRGQPFDWVVPAVPLALVLLFAATALVIEREPPRPDDETVTSGPDDETVTALEPPVSPPSLLVRSLQEELKRLGYYRGRVDGIWGPRSTAALQAFQREHGLEPTGVVTTEVLEQARQVPSPETASLPDARSNVAERTRAAPEQDREAPSPETTSRPRPAPSSASSPAGCIITIASPFVDLKYEPQITSADILEVPFGDYPVLSHRWVRWAQLNDLWFKIEANGREGWVLGNNLNVASRRGASCP